jgi:hypothetical protein
VVAKVDEQQAAVVALPVDPAGNAGDLADITLAKSAAIVRTIGVHENPFLAVVAGLTQAKARFVKALA